ncbi:hypothetical protein [Flavobacterium sp.]|uniref:hypothetical protein n=1 Tax=Flavobacterium sp. TaxID=239 RepID=UPI003D13F65D
MLYYIQKHLQGKKVALWLLLSQIVFILMLGLQVPNTNFTDTKIFDARVTGYSFEEAQLLLEKLGAEGRHVYLTQQLPLDMVFPFLFAVSCCLFLAFFLKKINALESSLKYGIYLPIVANTFDYLENFSVMRLLISHPTVSKELVRFSSTCTIIKYVLTAFYFLVLIFVLLKILFKYIKK